MHELGTGCHLWIGGKNHLGRARLWHNGKHVHVSRLVCEEVYGPSELDACHVPPCINKLCINPDHLYWGTESSNVLDRGKGITHYVWKHSDGGFVVNVRRVYIGIYTSLDEAIVARDEYMERIGHVYIPHR